MKYALVTGASSGVGKETALKLAKAGYHVYASARRVEKMQKELISENITVLPLDITKEESIQSTVDKIIYQAGKLDVLVNNAGYGCHTMK